MALPHHTKLTRPHIPICGIALNCQTSEATFCIQKTYVLHLENVGPKLGHRKIWFRCEILNPK